MTFPIRFAAAVIAFVAISCQSFAQSDAIAKRKAELLREILKEKMHAPFAEDNDVKATAAKTTASDVKVTPTGSSANEGEISIAYNPNDSNKIVISFMRNGSSGLSFPIYYSSNGGSTWTQSSFNSIAQLAADFPGNIEMGGGDPAFAWDKSGRLYYAWIYLSASSFTSDTAYFTLNWAYSDNDGHSWSVKPNHYIGQGMLNASTSDVLPYKDGLTDREWLAVDNSTGPFAGNVYCSFACFPAGTGGNFQGIKVMKPGIDTFGAAVPGYFGFSQFGNVAVDKLGRLHMSFVTTGGADDVMHVLSTNGGVSFGLPVTVAPVSDPFPSLYTMHQRENAAVSMAVDGPSGTGGNVYMAWSDYIAGATSFYSHSSDGGATWSTPTDLGLFFGSNATEMPVVAASGNSVSISLSAKESSGPANYYQLNSIDNGGSFNPPILLSSAPTDYVGIGANSSGSSLFFGDYTWSQRATCMVYSTWSDGRSAIPKVYFAKYNSCLPVTAKDVTMVNNDIQLVSVFPNPAKDNLALQVNSGHVAILLVQIVDMTGKVVFQRTYAVKEGEQQLSVPVSTLAYGNYALKLSNNDELIATRNVVAGK